SRPEFNRRDSFMKLQLASLLLLLFLTPLMAVAAADSKEIAAEAKTFLEMYNRTYQRLYTVANEAQWAALTDATDDHTGQRMGAEKAQAAVVGSPRVIEQARTLMQHSNALDHL